MAKIYSSNIGTWLKYTPAILAHGKNVLQQYWHMAKIYSSNIGTWLKYTPAILAHG
jgi:hypothetical protein